MVGQKENSGANKTRKNIRVEKTQHSRKIYRRTAEKINKVIQIT